MKIIILDASLDISVTIKSFLKDFSINDNEIFSFENGYEALDFIKLNGADIVFSDIEMPYMGGFEFAELVFKVIPDLKNSFFAISGDENRENYMKMKKNGVHRFLKKPINDEHFRNFIIPEILKVRYVEKNLSFTEMRQLISKM
jgi:two-component SAPR family response regulator